MRNKLISGLAALLIAGGLSGSSYAGNEKNQEKENIETRVEYKISQFGINAIKQFEGYSAFPYIDAAGRETIGYGHLY